MSTAGVYKHILNLEKLGYLTRTASGNVEINKNLQKVKVLWDISCGHWIDVIEIEPYSNFSEEIEVPSSMLKSFDTGYALKAEWDSMNEIGIFDWDYVVIKYQNTINDGDIGVVIIKDDFEEKALLKQIYKTPSSVLLKPKNERFGSIILWKDKHVEIRWKLVWVISNF